MYFRADLIYSVIFHLHFINLFCLLVVFFLTLLFYRTWIHGKPDIFRSLILISSGVGLKDDTGGEQTDAQQLPVAKSFTAHQSTN